MSRYASLLVQHKANPVNARDQVFVDYWGGTGSTLDSSYDPGSLPLPLHVTWLSMSGDDDHCRTLFTWSHPAELYFAAVWLVYRHMSVPHVKPLRGCWVASALYHFATGNCTNERISRTWW